jgi:ArsR family transcriptional regulator
MSIQVRSPVRARTDPGVPACCPPLRDAVPDPAEADAAAAAFRALADPVRVRLLALIAANGEVCACALVDEAGRSQPTVSHHLKVLREAGLVRAERRGTWMWYRVVPGRLAELRRILR